MISASDFGLSAQTDWDEPDNLVALHAYRKAVIFQLAAESAIRDEMLPLQPILDEMLLELGLDDESYSVYAFAGMMIEYDRMVRSETAEERTSREEGLERMRDLLDQMTQEFGGFDGFVQHCLDESGKQREEIETLNNLFEQDDQ